MWKKVINKFRGACEEVSEFAEAVHDEDYMSNKFDTLSEAEMLRLDREELRNRCRGFSKSDWEIILSEAPIEMVHNRIGSELLEAKRFKKKVKEAFSTMDISGLNM